MRDRAALTRSGLARPGPVGSEALKASPVDLRVHVTLKHLRSFENKSRTIQFLPKRMPASILNGRHSSRLKGRGLDFAELRPYVPGDDPRTIDWKVTARTGVAHIRVYHEERDRPVIIAVDQRMSMFFGTQLAMKSVTAAEAAALACFRVLDQGDRLGGLVFGDHSVAEIKPKRGRATCNRLLLALERANQVLDANAVLPDKSSVINQHLQSIARLARKNHLILFISDFDGADAETGNLIGKLAAKNDVILCPVTDPISEAIPSDMKLIVSDGVLQIALDTASGSTHKLLTEFATGRLASVLRWQHSYGVAVLPLSSGEDTAHQMSRLLGRAGQRQRSTP